MKKILAAGLVSLAVMIAFSCTEHVQVDSPADYVSTLVGTMSDNTFSTGNLYPATALPWGMNFWTPMTGRIGNGWTYSYSAHKIQGFKQTHQPSPWINDYGYFVVMPLRDASNYSEEKRGSWFSHHSETARPYYYQVYLCDHDVNAELTPAERAAMMRFTFPDSETSGIVIDACCEDAGIQVDAAKGIISGYTTNNHGGVPENFRNWFVVRSDKAIESYETVDNMAVIKFRTVRGEKVNLQLASSFISADQAMINLGEVEGRTFDDVRNAARDRWNEVLGRIEVSGGSEDQLRTFYSCLFRSTLFPHKFYEISAEGEKIHYSPYNGEVRKGTLYTDSGFWDVFRAQLPLLNLVYPSVNAEIQEGLMHIAEENPFLPEWASPGHRGCMVGNNSASIVADAYIKGIYTEGADKLYEALVYGTEHVHPQVSSSGRLGHEYYNSLGYVPYNVNINENVARTLEYAYDDWCILQMAGKLGRPQAELDKWASRAMNYRNVFDPSTNLMRGRLDNGEFESPFSPYKWGDAYTEGNAWHYTWSVFHDVRGLVDLMGGEKTFVSMLDSVFVVPPVYDDSYYGSRIHEITEMQVANMGNYAHGNQPAQHMVYLYDYAGQPWKCQEHVREVMDKLYKATPDGYCGDEDNGQTSAWYIFSALGFYPVCPGAPDYALGAPLFNEAVVHLESGKDLVISAPENAPGHPFVSSMKLNGRKWGHNYVNYDTLIRGAELKFKMASEPNTARGTETDDYPYSFSK